MSLPRDWWTDPEAEHGLLLVPIALYLAWRAGRVADPRPQPWLGVAVLVLSIIVRYAAGLAAELFTMRVSMFGAMAGIILFGWGSRQLTHWWLPLLLLLFSVPLPAVLIGSVTLSLQLQASEIGAWLLEWRHVPVRLAGNVIHLPGRSLFVAEACSGLRSLTALLSLGLLIGGLWLRTGWMRCTLLLMAIPIAVMLNGFRIFLIGFLAYHVDVSLGSGFLHYTEGWLLFMIALGMLGVGAELLSRLEARWRVQA